MAAGLQSAMGMRADPIGVLRDTFALAGGAWHRLRHRGWRVERVELVRACAWCTQVRDARNEWRDLEAYLRERFHIDLSHGICPDCLQQQLPGEEQHQ